MYKRIKNKINFTEIIRLYLYEKNDEFNLSIVEETILNISDNLETILYFISIRNNKVTDIIEYNFRV